jgi:hypothetical protein
MGTRSVTIVMGDNKELVRIYRQMDGYPDGHGLDLADLCDVEIVNGLRGDNDKVANGMGCLAARIIKGLKDGPGGIYIQPCNEDVSDWVEYVYIVRGRTGARPVIDVSNKMGPFPFNIQQSEGFIFSGTSQQWRDKYGKQPEDSGEEKKRPKGKVFVLPADAVEGVK